MSQNTDVNRIQVVWTLFVMQHVDSAALHLLCFHWFSQSEEIRLLTESLPPPQITPRTTSTLSLNSSYESRSAAVCLFLLRFYKLSSPWEAAVFQGRCSAGHERVRTSGWPWWAKSPSCWRDRLREGELWKCGTSEEGCVNTEWD